jgi:hypothetical protein
MIKLIVIHSITGMITVLTNSIVIDIIFIAITFIIVMKLLIIFRHFCFDKVEEN